MLLFLEMIPYMVIFIFGIVIGSFLNVCIYRMPLHESIITAPSHCMTCGTPIRKRDLIPIFSWCRLRGKCHSCGAKIPFRYTLVESLNAVLYVLIYAYFGIFDRPLYAGLVCLFCSALVVVFFMDLDTQLINLYVYLEVMIPSNVSTRMIDSLNADICE